MNCKNLIISAATQAVDEPDVKKHEQSTRKHANSKVMETQNVLEQIMEKKEMS